jgi:hypothetical protein
MLIQPINVRLIQVFQIYASFSETNVLVYICMIAMYCIALIEQSSNLSCTFVLFGDDDLGKYFDIVSVVFVKL